jgi:hypothetical protein
MRVKAVVNAWAVYKLVHMYSLVHKIDAARDVCKRMRKSCIEQAVCMKYMARS